MVIDILKLRQFTDPYVGQPADIYLNENPLLTRDRVACPTCETLAAHFYPHVSQAIEELNADAELKAVEVELREPAGKEWEAPRLKVD